MTTLLPRRFVLNRIVDETGISGTGIVAWGVSFPDGAACLRWNTVNTSTAMYASMEDVQAIHGHGGLTEVVWLDPEEAP